MTHIFSASHNKVISFSEITKNGWGFSVFEKSATATGGLQYLENGEGFATLKAAKAEATAKFGKLHTL